MSGQRDPKDKTFLITGGASGVGAVCVEWFLKEGAKSVAILDVSVQKGEQLTSKLNEIYPGKVIFYECDIGDETQLSDVFERVVDMFGQLDVIINNAGIMNDSSDSWKKSVDVNYRGLVSLTLKGVKHMRTDEGGAGGTVINVSSTAAFVKTTIVPIYCGTKAAVLQFSQCISIDPFHENTGVNILTFCLGPTVTPLLDNLPSKTLDEKSINVDLQSVETDPSFQKPESAADAMVKTFKEGKNGSIWLGTSGKPARDITTNLNAAFKTLEELVNS